MKSKSFFQTKRARSTRLDFVFPHSLTLSNDGDCCSPTRKLGKKGCAVTRNADANNGAFGLICYEMKNRKLVLSIPIHSNLKIEVSPKKFSALFIDQYEEGPTALCLNSRLYDAASSECGLGIRIIRSDFRRKRLLRNSFVRSLCAKSRFRI